MKTNSKTEDYLLSTIIKSLKPCPFCSSNDLSFKLRDSETQKRVDWDSDNTKINEEVACFNCGANMQRRKGVGVIGQWNLRSE